MSSGSWAFKPSDVKRAVKMARETGLDVRGLRFDKESFTVITGNAKNNKDDGDAGGGEGNEWDNI